MEQTASTALQAGLEQALWWALGLLTNRDLDAARALPGWSEPKHRYPEGRGVCS